MTGTPHTIPDENEARSIVRGFYFSIIPEVLLEVVSPRAYQLYGMLDRYAGKNRLAYPSRKTLAKKLGCSLSTVDRAIEELVAAGFLTVKPTYRPNGGKRPSLYILHAHGAEMTHGGDGPEVMHGDVSTVTHGDGPEMTHRDVSPVTYVNESQIRGEPDRSESHAKESHPDCVGTVASSPGLRLFSSPPAESRETLRDFSDEAVPPQLTALRDMSEELPQPKLKPRRLKTSKSKPKQSDELAVALAKADPVLVRELFDTWAETGNGKSHRSDERLGLIARALEWGFPAEDIRDALTGWVNDPWEERPRFKDVKYLLGSVEKVEAFRDLKRNPPTKKRDPGSGLRGDFSSVQSYLDFDESTAFGRKAK